MTEVSISPIDWEGGPAFLCFLRDVTEQHEAQKRLRESEERYRELVENIDGIVYVLDGTGNVIFINKALQHVPGQATGLPALWSGFGGDLLHVAGSR